MTEREELFLYIKVRYDAYLNDKKKCDLVMMIISEEQADILKSVGLQRKTLLMRAEIPAVLKKLEDSMGQLSLF